MFLQAIPEGRDGRWRLASDFIEHWIGPIGESDRVSFGRLDAAEERLGLRLPPALREWYERLGCRGDLWSVQDTFLPPEGLTLRGDLLAFYVENQAVWYIGVGLGDLAADDPPALIEEGRPGEGIRGLSPSVSVFVLQMLAYAVKFARPAGSPSSALGPRPLCGPSGGITPARPCRPWTCSARTRPSTRGRTP